MASIEEYAAGRGAFDDGDKVRASVVGRMEIHERDRTVGTAGPGILIPHAGDTIVGEVAATMASRMAITIRFVNGRRVTNNVECMLSTRNIRMRMVALVGDIMTLKVLGTLNGDIHATVDEPHLGVLFTKCRRCGQHVIKNRDGVKCIECGWYDDRKLSTEFGNSDFAVKAV